MSNLSVQPLKNIAKALLACAAIALPTQSASAITEERFFLFWNDWAVFGALGSDVVVGQFDGGLPNLDHIAWNGATILPFVYPIPVDANNDPIFSRQRFIRNHATAALGAIGARNESIGNSPLGGILGWAPESTMLVGGWGDDTNVQSGNINGISFEGLLFSLMMMTDQEFADAAVDNYRQYWQDYVDRYTDPFGNVQEPAASLHPNFYENMQPYRVATVVNLPFTNVENTNARGGADLPAMILNIVATKTNATFVSSVGNAGDRQDLDSNDPKEGSVGSPASAANVIGVGYTESGRLGQIDDNSGKGASPYRDRRVDFTLLDDNTQTLDPIPSEPVVFEARSGVDIVAPALELELPGSFIADEMDTTSFIKGWTGSSMASSIVTGAIAQLHDLHRKRYFADFPDDPDGEFSPRAVLDPIVTRAILLNSASREQGFRNSTAPSANDNDAAVTSTPLDERLGAGRLDMRRLLNQYLATPGLGGYQDLDNTGHNDGVILEAFRRDQSILDPSDVRLRNAEGYLITDINDDPFKFQGTDPNLAAVTFFRFPGDEGGRPGGLASATSTQNDEINRPTLAMKYGDVPNSNYTQITEAQLIPPGDDDGGLETTGGGGLATPGANTTGITSGDTEVIGGGGSGGSVGVTGHINPSAPSGILYASGWDHGMVGTGFLDLPIGLITEGSTVSLTLTWNEHMVLDQRVIDNIRDAIAPANLRAASDELLSSLQHQATAYGVPIPEPGTKEAEMLLFPEAEFIEGTTFEDEASFVPSVMGGYKVSTTDPPPGFDPAFNDDLDSFFDLDTNTGRIDKLADGTFNPPTSPFAGVCYMTAKVGGHDVSFTGVAIGPKYIITAAHNLDAGNDGNLDLPITTLNMTFYGADPDNDGNGDTITYTRSDLAPSGQGIRFHESYAGIGINPFGPDRGFANDLVLITLDLEDNVDDFDEVNIPYYSPSVFTQNVKLPGYELPGFPKNPPVTLLMVGYGASGYGNEGINEASFPENGFVRRVGWNQLNVRGNFSVGPGDLRLFATNYKYDFDGPVAIYGEGPLNDGITLGNELESIHTFGDSGSPMFEWLDSGDGMGGPADGKIQAVELRIFGLNTALSNGSAPSVSQFGAEGIGLILNPYANPAMNNWLNRTINEPPPPPLPGTPAASIEFDSSTGAMKDLLEWELENLNLELWRTSLDGSGNQLIAASRGEFYNTELIYIENDATLIKLGNYYARIIYENSIWDFGGFFFGGAESNPINNGRGSPGIPYVDRFEADTEYGFAYYIDLVRDFDIFGSRAVSTRDAYGNTHEGTEFYLKKTFEDYLGDMNADADIDGEDLGAMLTLWGQTGTPGQTRGDLDANGVVDTGDLAILLRNYTGSRDEE